MLRFIYKGGIMRNIIKEIIKNYKKWGRRGVDEYNTKSIFIEPLINSLGWNVKDLDVVEREAKVFGGGRVDFSLKLQGKPIMYIEAKAIKESLDDERFIAQAVNYANNDGVLWCLLTNGMDYRLYKSDEKGTISNKLMFKFSLKKIIDNPDTINEILEDLKLLSIENVKDKLPEKAKVVFIDSKVKKVIEKLKRAPSRKFINIIRDELEKEYTTKEIKDSILRISGIYKKPPQEKEVPIKTEEFHLKGINSEIKDIYLKIKDDLLKVNNNIIFNPQKYYISIIHNKNIAYFTFKKKKIKLVVKLPEEEVSMKIKNYDVIHLSEGTQKFYGSPCCKIIIDNKENLDEIINLLIPLIRE